jgi:hypothetical protein
MRRVGLAVGVGLVASMAALWSGEDRPGSWVAEGIGGTHPYDVFIHDHYLIVRPVALLLNAVVFSVVVFGVLAFAQRLWSRRGGAAA